MKFKKWFSKKPNKKMQELEASRELLYKRTLVLTETASKLEIENSELRAKYNAIKSKRFYDFADNLVVRLGLHKKKYTKDEVAAIVGRTIDSVLSLDIEREEDRTVVTIES